MWRIPSSRDFNPRAPCGARQIGLALTRTSLIFQSTRPVRGATGPVVERPKDPNISIHAPRAGRDPPDLRPGGGDDHFNPRAPCGARRPHRLRRVASAGISIHAPRAGRDGQRRLRHFPGAYFNPRAPCGARRRLDAIEGRMLTKISIHAPRAGRDA